MLMKHVNDTVQKNQCSGCGVCALLCPAHCITMQRDSEGFLYPAVDAQQCIDCGLCTKRCPIHTKIDTGDFDRRVFLVQHRDDRIRRESTSGGAFTAIAETVIDSGGVVFGAAMCEGFRVCHIPVFDKEGLSRFRNSKYAQSDLGDSFASVKQYLEEDRTVLFSGTPCQVAGLKSYLGDNPEKLITVDVVCRGVPSPLVFEKYIDYQNKKLGKFDNVVFRDKYAGYTHTTMSFYNCGQCLYHNGLEYDPMLKLFYKGLISRPSCADCRFKGVERPSDFTLWDCFSASDTAKEFDDNKGTTNVMLHSEKAEALFGAMRERIRSREGDAQKICRSSAEMSNSASAHPDRNRFFSDMENMDAESLFRKWTPVTLKVRAEKLIRNVLAKTGLYYKVKKAAAKFK